MPADRATESIARTQPRMTINPRDVLSALDEVADPEIPTVSIVEMGMVERIEICPEGLLVELLPTFVGCPAVEVIRAAVTSRLEAFGRPVRVEMTFSTPWTSDRISPRAARSCAAPGSRHRPTGARRQADRDCGRPRAADGRPGVRDCGAGGVPLCGSSRTTLEKIFGPTQCRSIRHCADCRQPFEAFKPV